MTLVTRNESRVTRYIDEPFRVAIWRLLINVLLNCNAYGSVQRCRRNKHKSPYRSNEKEDAKVLLR